MRISLPEQETILRWDRETGAVSMWTASAVEVRRWRRLGYAVEQEGFGWRAVGPKGCVRIRRVGSDGQLVKRTGRVPVIRKGDASA